jgi:4-amino-4-deoxy-L-arabinose transferase-like glycosyltransferase
MTAVMRSWGLPALLALLSVILMALGWSNASSSYAFDVDDPLADRSLSRFFRTETNNEDRFRWSEPVAAIFPYGFGGRPALLDLRLAAPRAADADPALVQLAVDGAAFGSMQVERPWRHYRILVPTGATGTGAIRLAMEPYRPDTDPRELGLVLSDVRAERLQSAIPLPPWSRTIYLGAIPLLGWLALRRIFPDRSGRHDPALWVGLALLVVPFWATLRPIEGSYWLPSIGWPWIPLIPLLLLIVAPQIVRSLQSTRRIVADRPWLAWVGLLAAVLALTAMRVGLPGLPGLLLLGLGVWLGLAAVPEVDSDDSALDQRLVLVALGLIVLGALGLRFFNLGGQPPALWRDESRHALLALQIWNDPSFRPVYVVEGADLPALLFYLMAPIVGTFGPEIWSARVVSALAGGLTPLALYWAATPLIGRRGALLAAALIAWASWSLSMSRWAFPATLDHLLVLTAIGLVWRGLDRLLEPASRGQWQALAFLGLGGFLGGLATYAYHTGRMAPIALAVLVLVRLGFAAPLWRRALPGLVVAVLVGLLTMAPLLFFIATNYEGYNRRVGTVTVFSTRDLEVHRPVRLLLQNAWRYVLMWHVQGEPNGRHHMPDAPMVGPAVGLLFALGLALALARRRRALLAVVALLLVYLVPGEFSGSAPHAMRSLGTLAPTCMLAGLAFAGLSQRFNHLSRRGGVFAVGGVLVFSLAFNLWLYFGLMAVEPRVYGEYDMPETAMGMIARAPVRSDDPELGSVQVYLPAEWARADSVRYLTYGLELSRLEDGVAPEGPALVLLFVSADAEERAAALAALGPEGREIGPVPTYPARSDPILIAYGRGDAAERLLESVVSAH